MSPKKNGQDPQQDLMLAAANNVPAPQDEGKSEIRYNQNISRNVMKRNQYRPGAWGQGGTLDCFASTDWALTELARLRNIPTNPNSGEVDKVQVARKGEETRIWIFPTDPTDADGIEVKRSKGQPVLNFFLFLAKESLLVPMGKRERYELTVVTGPESPVGPALLLDFAKPMETKLIKKKSSAKKNSKPKPEDQKENGSK